MLGWLLGRRNRVNQNEMAVIAAGARSAARELAALREAYPSIRYRLLANGTVLERSQQPDHSERANEDSSIGFKLQDLVTESFREAFMTSLLKAIESGQAQTVEYRLKSPQWDGYFEGRMIPSNPGECLLFARDVSARYRAEQDRIELENRLRQLFRMEALGQLAGGVAHDFNNILTVITGHSQLIREQVADEKLILEDLDQIDIATGGAASLTRRLLAFSRDQDIALEWIDLEGVIGRIRHMLDRLLRDDIELCIEIEPDTWQVRADEGALEQVFVNLALNSADAMETGGRFTIETKNLILGEEDLDESEELEAGRYVCIKICDTGKGMSPEVRNRAFEPFFTTKSLGRGTGLGLASAYGIIQKSRGFIRLESEEGVGTTFHLYLPASIAQQAILPTAPETRSSSGRETVLLCEDDPAVGHVISESLSSSGYQVLAARSAEEAMKIEDELHDPLHLLVTDVVMAGISGGELADLLRERRPGLRVLFVSGYPKEVVAHHCKLAEDDRYISKPFTPRELLELVREVLDRKSPRIWT